MSNNDDKLISAQVVIGSAADATAVMEEFKRAGFEVGPLFGNSFSITAEASKFESYFNATLELSSREAITVRTKENSIRSDLPLDSVSEGVRDKITAIVFSRPPDFGPGGDF